MPERIHKLQPDRTLHLRGFDGFGAAAALHSATPGGFRVSGVFRDPADFAVLMLYDADNFYEHPSIRYLPDFDFRGLTLSFDVRYSGLMPLDSPKWPTIDWPYLDAITGADEAVSVELFPHATQRGGAYTRAAGRFTVVNNSLKQFDRVTLWYLNLSFDVLVEEKVEQSYAFYGGTPGTVHSITAGAVTTSYTEKEGDTSAAIAAGLASALAGSPDIIAIPGDGTPEKGPAHQLNLRARRDDASAIVLASTAAAGTATIYAIGAETVARRLAAQINSVDWVENGVELPLSAQASGADLLIECSRPGADGNCIEMYAVAKNGRLATTESRVRFAGGSSDAVWHIDLEFDKIGLGSVRQLWLTFAPPLPYGKAFESREWEAEFTNWTVSGPEQRKVLRLAGPGSVRIEDDNPQCRFSGGWTVDAGFYTRGFARRSDKKDDAVSISYECASTHDLYLGTSLFLGWGRFHVSIDGRTLDPLDTRLKTGTEQDPGSPVYSRRALAFGLAAGKHTVVLTHADDKPVFFDFLEAAVVSETVPAPLRARTDASPALDYSTDHTYKLSPARLMWNFDQLGFAGPMNEYIGVFWWNQRVRSERGRMASATVRFSGEFKPKDQVFVQIGDQKIGKTIFPDDTHEIIARHFASFINTTFVGAWAAAGGDAVLTVTSHSAAPAYEYEVKAWVERQPGSSGAAVAEGSLTGGVAGDWMIDPQMDPPLNRAARDWHADLFREGARRAREITVACSMELVNPPPSFPARFPDPARTPVETQVFFANLTSAHCGFNSAMLAYQKQVYSHLAQLMETAGIVPNLQFGEFCWWYFPNDSGMAFYDDDTLNAARAALGQDLHVFVSAGDDPAAANGGADADFLRRRLRDHVAALCEHIRAAHPAARLELLFPYDVNYPRAVGMNKLGGKLLRHINFPLEWAAQEGSGLDRMKMEGLDFGAYTHDLDLAVDVMRFPLQSGWPKDAVRYMIPVFKGGCPWVREYRLASSLGVAAMNFWAWDHFSIFGWDVTELDRVAHVSQM